MSGFGYVDIECKQRENEKKNLSFDRLEQKSGWNTKVIETNEREGFSHTRERKKKLLII